MVRIADRDSVLDAPWAVAGAILLVLTLAFPEPLNPTEVDTLLYAKHQLDPSFLPGDWTLSTPPGPRLPFQLLVWPILAVLPLPAASLVARTACHALLAVPLSLIARRQRVDAAGAAALAWLYLQMPSGLLPLGEDVVGSAESKAVAYALLLLAGWAFATDRLAATGLLAGLATSVHVIVGGWGTAGLGLAVLASRAGDPRRLALTLALWAGGAVWGLLAVWGFAAAPETIGSVDVDRIVVYFRNPHHLDLGSRSYELHDLTVAGLATAALAAHGRLFPSDPALRRLARFALGTTVPLALGVLATLSSRAAEVLVLYPFRVGNVVPVLLAVWVVGPRLFDALVRPPARAAAIGTVLLLGGADLGPDVLWTAVEWGTGDPRVTSGARGDEAASLVGICREIRARTRPGDVVLADPGLNNVQLACQRPVVATFQHIPNDKAHIAAWYRRLEDLNGGPIESTGFDATRELRRNFGHHRRGTYCQLAETYGARTLLLDEDGERRPLDLPVLARARPWTAYDLAGCGTPKRGRREGPVVDK